MEIVGLLSTYPQQLVWLAYLTIILNVIAAHYPRDVQFIDNYCRDGRQDFGETGVDSGWPCP